MSKAATLEARLDAVERDLAELRDFVRRASQARPWYERMVGSMKDYPEFAEVVRLRRKLGNAADEVSRRRSR